MLTRRLSTAEQVAYHLLVDRPSATAAELAGCWHISEDLSEALATLAAMGLANPVPSEPGRYAAVPPGVAIEPLISAAEAQAENLRGQLSVLASQYRARSIERAKSAPIEVVVGLRAVRQRVAQIQRGARRELRCFDKPPYVDPEGTTAGEFELLREGVVGRTLYEHDLMAQPGTLPAIEALVNAGQQARSVPSLPMKLYVADDQLAIFPVKAPAGSEAAAMVVHASTLLDALTRLFEALWERGLPLRPQVARTSDETPGDGRAGVTVEHQRLFGLLLAGLTDEAIARQLGVSCRTVERRIAALCAELGARTRFQAGVQAALRELPAHD